VAIARAVAGQRVLLLADEPAGALDSLAGEAVLALLRARCDDGIAGVLVTHEARYAAVADRVVFLGDGRVVDQATAGAALPAGGGSGGPGEGAARPAGPRSGAVTAGPGRGALARLAWRDAARHRGRSLLVATVLALPTAMLASATVVLRTGDPAASRFLPTVYPMAMPWPTLALVVLAVPAVAAATAALTTGGPAHPPTERRPA
jgi:energy-coupling factor transporter ATP-binding protein EcfA2